MTLNNQVGNERTEARTLNHYSVTPFPSENEKKYIRMFKEEHLYSILNSELLQKPYLVDEGYRILPESSYFKTPESEIVAGIALIIHGIYLIYSSVFLFVTDWLFIHLMVLFSSR